MFNLLPYLLGAWTTCCCRCRFSAGAGARTRPGDRVPRRGRRLLAALGLTIPTLLDRRSTQLSIGQQQRVAAARALIGRPELVIADEPTSSLDADAARELPRLLMDECRAPAAPCCSSATTGRSPAQFDRQVDLLALNQLTGTHAA